MNQIAYKFGVIILLTTSVFFHTDAFSQKLYIKANIGYGLGINKDDYKLRSDYNQIYLDSTEGYSKYDLKSFSLGQGLNVEASLGSFLGKHISVEITGFYHKSSKHTLNYEELNTIYSQYQVDFHTEEVYTGKMYGLKPNLVFWGGGDNFRPYIKLGGVIGIASMTRESQMRIYNTHPNYYPTEDYTSVFEYKSHLNLGYTVSVGFEIILAKDLKFFSECSYTAIRYIPTSGEYTEYKYRGKDMLNTLTINERYIEFEDTYYSTENESETSPAKLLKNAYSFSNISLSVGIRLNLIN